MTLLQCQLCLLVLLLVSPPPTVIAQRFHCVAPYDCVDRPSFHIQAIVHGTYGDSFWLQVQAAMFQAGSDMNVTFGMKLYDVYDSNTMANDISAIGTSFQKPDALIVSVPDGIVQNAVGNLIQDYQLPVFGVNVGANVANAMGILGFVSIDDYLGGKAAGEFFASADHNHTNGLKGLFVNPDYSNVYLEERYLGLTSILDNADISKLVVDGTSYSDMSTKLNSELTGCPFHIILMAEATPLQYLLDAMHNNGCSYNKTMIGTFDVSPQVYQTIAADKLKFAISQQAYLQGASTVVMATIFATTGKVFAQSAESTQGNYLSGPVMITRDNLPSLSQETCETDAYPVCPNTTAADGSVSQCRCTERSQILIAGVTHGVTTDSFWDEVYAAADQAGKDFGVDLQLVRFQPEATDAALYAKYSAQIHKFCNQEPPISGLFVSLTNQIIVEAVQYCVFNKSIPVIAINTGSDQAAEAGVLSYIGQAEFSAGKGAGQLIIDAGVTTGICLYHDYNNSALEARCAGMEEAFNETSGVTYLGAVYVPPANGSDYISIVEKAIGIGGSWSGYGVLILGLVQLPYILELQHKHSALKIGAFDTSAALYNALSNGTVLFSIDQNSYLQGYWPVPFLTWYVSTGEALVNKFIESGPRIVTSVPTLPEQACEAVYFDACPNSSSENAATVTSGTQATFASLTFSFLTTLSVLAVLLSQGT